MGLADTLGGSSWRGRINGAALDFWRRSYPKPYGGSGALLHGSKGGMWPIPNTLKPACNLAVHNLGYTLVAVSLATKDSRECGRTDPQQATVWQPRKAERCGLTVSVVVLVPDNGTVKLWT